MFRYAVRHKMRVQILIGKGVRALLVLVDDVLTTATQAIALFPFCRVVAGVTRQTSGMDMEQIRLDWLQASARACNARQMYRLAYDVAMSSAASQRHRRAARRVVKILHHVIDKPIAKAAVLAAARRRFDGLVAELENGAS